MPPIFTKQNTTIGGVFSSDKVKLTFSSSVNGVLVQGMNFTYSQNVTRLYEVGSEEGQDTTNVYYVGGRTQGTLQLNRVIGPNTTISKLYSEYGDICKSCDNHITLNLLEASCCPDGGEQMTYTCKFCVLVQVGVSVQAQDMIINEQSQIMFSGLDYSGGGSGGDFGGILGDPGVAAAAATA